MLKSMTSNIAKQIETLFLKVYISMLEWKLNAFIIDDVITKISVISINSYKGVYSYSLHYAHFKI